MIGQWWNMDFRWNIQDKQTDIVTAPVVKSNNPLMAYITTQQTAGLKKNVIMENLMKQGFSYRAIRQAYSILEANKDKRLDWRSPTAVNETARMIRRDIRGKKLSYALGMKILIQARNMLKTLIRNPRKDLRLKQINQEIKTTRNLLMKSYADPRVVSAYKVYGGRPSAPRLA